MKKTGADVAQLSPIAHGWRLHYGGTAREMPGLAEVAAFLPASAQLHLALPCQMALLERLTLPATNREELAGMAQLQLEKTLPYPVEEAASELEVIRQAGNESTVVTIAVHTDSLSRLCEPLRSRQRAPQKITLYAQHLAAVCPAGETVLAVWSEQENIVLAIFENRKLSWAHTQPVAETEGLAGEIPTLLLGAEMEGVPTNVSRVLLADGCARYQQSLAETLGAPVEVIATSGLLDEPTSNLLPPAWADETQRVARGETLRNRLMLAAVIYLMAVAVAFVYLALLKRQVQKLDVQIDVLQPRITQLQAEQHRWQELAPAIDPALSVVEILYQTYKSRPSSELRITSFVDQPKQFTIDGEAPEAALAVDYADKLRKNKELGSFHIDSPPPIFPNGHAQFRIFGKL